MAKQGVASENTKAHKLAHWMDEGFTIPGTGIKFGFDSIIGLIPGAGDLATGLISCYYIVLGVRQGVPASVLFHMALNILADVLIGSIPILGDIFDVAWKANVKNAELLEQYS